MRADLPTGTVTFLFTDVEGSTKLLHELGAEAYADALAEHRRVVRKACVAQGGVEVDTQGDAFFFAFPSASGAAAAAHAMTEALAPGRIHLRIGLHTGTPVVTHEGYVGDAVHLAARVAASGHGGQVVLSQATGALLDGHTLTDLGEHRLKDIEGTVAILQLGDISFPPLKTISNTNLPRPASSFVGRAAELAHVLSLVEDGSRLVTLTGPGGSGKTRLALEAAATLVPFYKAGTFWVGLASLRDPSLVTATIAQTIGSKNGLAEHIAEREMLLLLDNLEQVIEVAPEISALLPACPNLTLLVTSRELLRVQGEVEYEVPPLASPEALSLFCARSRLEPSEDIAELCARLDDLPLALELAAARTKVLSPRQILERLAERLDLLRGGRDADPRQQTLRATIEWSYDLLPDEEQRLFRALSVFSGGCTLEAAKEVADADLDILQSLIEKSLIRFSNERYWMLETIREYARERAAWSEPCASAERHARYFLAQLEERAPAIRSSRRGELLAWFGEEADNFRAALDRLDDTSPLDAARAVDLLTWFWIPRGQLFEGRDRTRALLDREEVRGGHRAVLLEHLSDFEQRLGDFDSAIAAAEEAVELAQSANDRRTVCFSLRHIGFIAVYRGDVERASELFARVLKESDEDENMRSLALGDLGVIDLEAGRYEDARLKLREASKGFRATRDEANDAVTSINLAWLELYTGHYEAAFAVGGSVLERNRSIGDHYRGIGALNVTGFALLGLGRRAEARHAFGASLDLVLASGMTRHEVLTETVTGIALAAPDGALRRAARLRGAVDQLDHEYYAASPRWLELRESLEPPLVEQLGQGDYAIEQSIGARMSLEETIELARSLADS